MIDVSVARLKLSAHKLETIPKGERWMLCDEERGTERVLKRGVRLSSLGIKIPALPNDTFKKGTEGLYPKDFNLKAFKDSTKGKGNYEISRERLYLPMDRIIPCQNWLDAQYVHDIMEDLEFLLQPIKVSQYGTYFWITDGTHRYVATQLLFIRATIDFVTYNDAYPKKTKVRKKK